MTTMPGRCSDLLDRGFMRTGRMMHMEKSLLLAPQSGGSGLFFLEAW